MNNKLKYFHKNDTGRDFVVGDLHGCFDDLQYVLSKGLNFDATKDRLFSVGDLIDRGPASMMCADLLYEPWFHAVRGNHEQMMIDAVLHHDQDMKATWFWNGGQWAQDYHETELNIAATKMDELPLVISVGSGEDRFNIVHGDLLHFAPSARRGYGGGFPILVTDDMIDNWVFSEEDEWEMLWGRYIIANNPEIMWQDKNNLSLTFVGHTPRRDVCRSEQQMYLDNGAVYYHTNQNKSEGNHLVLACPTEKVVYMYNMMWKTIKQVPFDEILTLK